MPAAGKSERIRGAKEGKAAAPAARNIGGGKAERGANGERFDGPRSPPNTAHVPCKFFRQGACQAGNACPFSHDIGAAAENVCKYFAKGNCKFGPKCANIHVLPDGRRVNYGKHGLTLGGTALSIGRQHHNPTAYAAAPTSSALTYSLRTSDYTPSEYDFDISNAATPTISASQVVEGGLNIPALDVTGYSESFVGSPREEAGSLRLGLGLSSALKSFSALDAPLPASFDSTGFSNAALYPQGPWPSSVPSKFGMESPLPSLTSPEIGVERKAGLTSAFGAIGTTGGDHLSSSHVVTAGTPSNPLLAVGEEQFGRRMHSASSRFAKPKLLSASVPKTGLVDRDWDPEFAFLEEDYVPQNLQELLTPAEKARRGTLRVNDDDPIGLSSSYKYGSPILSGSPSRWGPVFPRKEEELTGSVNKVSAFGVVGSPLRTSSLAADIPPIRPNGTLGTSLGVPGYFGTPSKSYNDGFSILSAQLRQTRIDDTSRLSGSPLANSFLSVSHHGHAHAGSSRLTQTINEEEDEEEEAEDDGMMFDMEDDEDMKKGEKPTMTPAMTGARTGAGAVTGTGMPPGAWSYSAVLKAKAGVAKEGQ